ncbi:MAG: type II toxin-antitoxin system RelE/ParE family toxin [Pirellulaceae bacterium]|nr:type II toxin-antitoxin system RelE/ParE family toxin [Pirellulaceae bacterium]
MAEMLRTPDAEGDLVRIWAHIAQESGSLSAADRQLDRIDEKCRLLASYPEIAPPASRPGP